MHKEAQTTRASSFKRPVIGVWIVLFAGCICFLYVHSRITSASLKVLGFGTNQCGDFVLLQLTNAGPGTIVYSGYETNYPQVTLEFQTSTGRHSLSRSSYKDSDYSLLSLYDVELKPRQSVQFRVLTSDMQHDFRVGLPYIIPTTPGPLEWLRYRAYRISGWRWLHSSYDRTALTPLITTNSKLAAAS